MGPLLWLFDFFDEESIRGRFEGLQILAVKCWIDFGGLPTEVALEMCVPSITREMNKNIFCICRLYSDSDSRGWLKVHPCAKVMALFFSDMDINEFNSVLYKYKTPVTKCCILTCC